MGNTNLKLDIDLDIVDKMVDENIISKSKSFENKNYWALDAIINEKARFFSSIINLKDIIKTILSYSNLVEEEREEKFKKFLKNCVHSLSIVKDIKVKFSYINGISIYLTLYNFFYRTFFYKKYSEFEKETTDLIFIELSTKIKKNLSNLYKEFDRKKAEYVIKHDLICYLMQFNIIGSYRDEKSVIFKLKNLSKDKTNNLLQRSPSVPNINYGYETTIFQDAFKEIAPSIFKQKLISNKFTYNYNQIIIKIYNKWNEVLTNSQNILDQSETQYTENNSNESFVQVDAIFYKILLYIYRKRDKHLLLSFEESLAINENNPKNKIKDDIANVLINNIQIFANDPSISNLFVEFFLNYNKLLYKTYSFFSIIIDELISINEDDDIYNNLYIINKYENEDLTLLLISKSNNDIVNDMILNIFENKMNAYFSINFYNSNIKEETFNFLNTTFECFEQCIFFLEQENYKFENNLISKIYCISFIKIYLYRLIIIYNDKNNNIVDIINVILEVINGNNKSNIAKMIKIYLLKLLFKFYEKDYILFLGEFKKDFQILYDDFKKTFSENINKENKQNKKYYFLPSLDEFQKYKEVEKEFISRINGKYAALSIQDFGEYIQKYDIDKIFIVVTNIILSQLNNNELYTQFSDFLTDLITNYFDIPEITKKLILSFVNNKELAKIKKLVKTSTTNENDKSKEDKKNQKYLIILINALRICLQTTCQGNEFFYSQIISENYKKTLKDNSIPGNAYSNNIYIDNYYLIEKFLKSHQDNSSFGAYTCSCGLFYDIGPCGFPTKDTEKKICQNCGKDIGYAPKPKEMNGKHEMVIRDGHYRIFLDLNQKNKELNRFGDNDINIPNMILSDYRANIINPKMEEQAFDINKPSKDIFKYNDIKIRKLSTVGYRLLNFILYSHFFFQII